MKHYILLLIFLAMTGVVIAQQTESILLEKDSTSTETIKVPFGELSKDRVVGAVDVIEGKSILHSPEYNVESTLAGQAAGLIVFKGNGSPGVDNTSLKIRGYSRGGASDAPLIVIDGMANRALSSIALDEIESIQVLKDVTAKMLYGSKAANGVLMITTKRGYNGKKQIRFTGEYGVKTPTALPEYINSADYARLYNQALTNDGLEPLYSNQEIDTYANNPSILYPDVDFYNELLRSNTSFRRVNAELIGGNDNTQYFLNLGYVGEGGMEKIGKRQQFNRLNVRSNLDYRVTDVVTMKLDIAARIDMWERANIDNGALFNNLSSHRPNDYPLYVSPVNDLDSLGYSSRVGSNLVGDLARSGYWDRMAFNSQANLGMNFDLNKYVDGLSASVLLSFDIYNRMDKGKALEYSRIDPSDFTRIGVDTYDASEGRRGDDYNQNVGIVSQIDYVKSFGDHDLKINFASITQTLSRKSTLDGRSTQQDDKTVNLGLRANYAFKDKYVLEGSTSLMGSDKFTKENRWGLFGAAGLGWIVSNEDFLSGSDLIDYLKIKGTYGVIGYDRSSGNDDDFDYLLYQDNFIASGNFRTGATNNNIEFGWIAGQIGNPDLTFEKSRELNIGVEATLFDNKLKLEANYFDEYRYDIPVRLNNALPDYAGSLAPIVNYNEISNKGVDFFIKYSNKIGDLSYSLGGNFMVSKAKYEVFDELNEYEHQNRTGRATDEILGWIADGLYQTADDITNHGVTSSFGDVIPGDIKYENITNDRGDNVIDEFDRTFIGNWNPRMNYAINVNLEYKGVELYVLGQGVSGFDRMLTSSYYYNTGNSKYSVEALGAAYPGAVAGATHPRLTSFGNGHSYRGSTYWMEDGSYFKLRTVELSYTLPQSISSKIASSKVKVFARGNDLLAISKIEDLDPENLNAGINNYPMFKTVSFGLKLVY